MNNSTLNKILIFLILVVFGWNIYTLKDSFGNFLKPFFGERNPCNQPVTYSIGEVDSRFGISKNEFAQIIKDSIQIWEKPIGKTLFEYSDSGELKINLIYDSRQNATQKLNQLGINITNDQAGYNTLKSRYNSAMADYNQLNFDFQNKLNAYNAEKSAYDQQVNYWNKQGGAPKNEYNKLQQQQTALNNEANTLNQLRTRINSKGDEINALATTLNQLAEKLNLNINTYNGIGTQQGEEFEEGVFTSDASGMTINIYQFDNRTKLIRVIGHELGHALGISHIDNPQAIMHKINSGNNLTLSSEDLQALKNVCRLSN